MPKFNSTLYEILGSRIKSRREELRLNQNDLGEKAGVGRTSISNIEQGRQKPPLSVIYNICQSLDIDVHSVLPTYSEVLEAMNPESKSNFDPYYDIYNVDEKTQRTIESLFKTKKK